jgi:hypothetical protein
VVLDDSSVLFCFDPIRLLIISSKFSPGSVIELVTFLVLVSTRSEYMNDMVIVKVSVSKIFRLLRALLEGRVSASK